MKLFKAIAILPLLLSTAALAQWPDKIDFETEQYLCAVNFIPVTGEIELYDVTYHWDFGDGHTSHERTPVHQFKSNGKHSVTLTIENNSGGKISKKKQFRFHADKKLSLVNKSFEVSRTQCDQVIEAEMYTFLDEPFEKFPLASHPLQDHMGVWKRGKTYTYLSSRNEEGLFSVVNFKGRVESILQEGWKERTIDPVEGNSIPTNNAVLKDKTQSYVIASCVNARQDEIAYTGFETQSLTTGNWIFSAEAFHTYQSLPLISGYKNFMLVELDPGKAHDINLVEINAEAIESGQVSHHIIPVLCQQVYEKNKNWSILILASMPFDGLWDGDVRSRVNIQQDVPKLTFDREVSHSGTTSLSLQKTTTINQPLLNLKGSKEYVISLWVSSSLSRKRNTTVDGAGIELIFIDEKGQEIQSNLFPPSGAVIEGWQQVSSTFVVPEKFSTFNIKFMATDMIWFDDLRLYPAKGNMQAFVYDPVHNRQCAVLDENNRANFFYYSDQGTLFQQKKETDGGVKTMVENIQYIRANQ